MRKRRGGRGGGGQRPVSTCSDALTSSSPPQLSKGCSLHLAQRWSQLFNIQLRRMSILSKDSAPGLIMATGEHMQIGRSDG